MRRGLGPALWLAGLALLAAPVAGDAAPLCASDCEDLAEKGELRESVTVQECAASVCHQEGRNLYRQNKHEEALASLDYVQETLAESPSYLLDRGLVLYALERFEEALATFDKILETRPTSFRAGAQRAHTLARLGKLELAQAQFEAMSEWPGAKREFREIKTTSYLRGNIGLLKLRRGDLAGGKSDLEEAIEIDGNNSLADTLLHRVVPSLEDGTLSPGGLTQLTAAFEAIELAQAKLAEESFRALLEDSPRYVPGYLILAQGLPSSASPTTSTCASSASAAPSCASAPPPPPPSPPSPSSSSSPQRTPTTPSARSCSSRWTRIKGFRGLGGSPESRPGPPLRGAPRGAVRRASVPRGG
jgi:tetratricopeptide (TPR) repeat protein